MNASWILMLAVSAAPDANESSQEPSPQRVQEVVASGLDFISSTGPTWRKGGCVNCHHGTFTIWSQRAPADAGFSVNESDVDEYEEVLLKRFLPTAKDGRDSKNWRHHQAAYFTLAQPAEWNPATEPDKAEAFVHAMKSAQRDSGSWPSANPFRQQRRAKGEAALLQTLWNINALSRLESFDSSLSASREKAMTWVRETTATPPSATDVRAVLLLTEHRFGDPTTTQTMLSQLLDDQNDDGSWGWMSGEQSDAWATGVMLYVLSFLVDEVPADRISRAQSYLVESQAEDGSWLVESKAKKGDDVSSFFGTAWSVMGLSRTMATSQQ